MTKTTLGNVFNLITRVGIGTCCLEISITHPLQDKTMVRLYNSVGPAEKSFRLYLIPVNINYLQVNLYCYLFAEYVLQV